MTWSPMSFLHRQALAGDHRLVQAGAAFPDDAVHRDLLARPHDDDVADRHLLHRDIHLLAVAHDPRRPGLQADELLDGLGGLALGPGLEQAAQQDEGDDDGRGIEVDVGAAAAGGEEAGEQDGRHAVEVGRRGAHGDEGVHVGGAVLERAPRPPVELPARPELDRRGQRPEQVVVAENSRQPCAGELGEGYQEHVGADDAGHDQLVPAAR